MIYAMSDIHGCIAPLNAALETVNLRDGRSKLILLGDYCDRGPDSLQVYERIMRLQEEYPGQITPARGCWPTPGWQQPRASSAPKRFSRSSIC